MVYPVVKSHPFPHAQVNKWWDNDLLVRVVEEFILAEKLRPMWKRFHNPNEKKLEGGPALFGSETRYLAQLIADKAPELEEAFDLPPLTMELVGGGYHLIKPGGLLNVHSDFSVSPKTGAYRRLNLLIYLNWDWKPINGGELELWDDEGPAVKITPEFNRTAIFQTSATSWHGHPTPVFGRSRRSFAAYFYSKEQPPDFTNQDTVWHPRAPKIGA